MRLTLRTMLAYLDDILEPQDAEALGAKISDSEFASELVYRALSSTRKANLNAPPLDGNGIGGDPNSVAEYLDNTLEETRIPSFEKVCLESDMYLSEVACCHSILSICIDQPVAIENDMRDRVLALVETSLGSTQELAQMEQHPRSVLENLIEPKPAGAPEYIRKKAHPLWQATVIVTFVGLIAMIGLRAVGPLDQTHPWIGSMFSGAVVDQDLSENAVYEEDQAEAAQQDQSQTVLPQNYIQPVTAPEGLDITQSAVEISDVVVADENALVFTEGESFAELLSDSQPLLHASNAKLDRLVAGASINVGDTIVGFEGFRPELLLKSGAKLTLASGARIETSLVEETRLGLSVHYGKVILQGSNSHNLQVRLLAGGIEFDLDLGGDLAVAALETVPYQPASGEMSRAIRLFYNNSVKISGLGSVNETLDSNQEHVTVFTFYPGNTDVTRVAGFPRWATGVESNSIMKEARIALIHQLSKSDNLQEALQQAYESHRLINVRRLAAYGLLEMGSANAVVGLLDDGNYRALWQQDVRLLKEYYHRDETSRKLVETALSSYSGDNTDQVLSFLSEYDDAHLSAGVADEMVQQLKSQVTVSRVIAFERLKLITGKTLLYKPEEVPQRQTLPIREWDALLSEGKLGNVNED
ncbi:MAG: hypothetical protein VX776_00245, partial [Planctomycetota bacterium]|nr:hypothetical protein [Planctomycetota bacterium]